LSFAACGKMPDTETLTVTLLHYYERRQGHLAAARLIQEVLVLYCWRSIG